MRVRRRAVRTGVHDRRLAAVGVLASATTSTRGGQTEQDVDAGQTLLEAGWRLTPAGLVVTTAHARGARGAGARGKPTGLTLHHPCPRLSP